MSFRIVSATAQALCVPLQEPFVIATARMDTTRAALIRIVGRRANGTDVIGLGEAACLYPVTQDDMPEVLAAAANGLASLEGHFVEDVASAGSLARKAAHGSLVLESALECALTDALARAHGLSICALYNEPSALPVSLESDITIPIGTEETMLRAARTWYGRGFRAFKAKVGKDAEHEARALGLMHATFPGIRFRLDANAGYGADEALFTLRELRKTGAQIECFEQPCGIADLDGMARVVRDGAVDVVADESLRSTADLKALIEAKAATSVNLKIVKLGGFGPALAIGRAALAHGLGLMVGGMVETRLGMTCAATLAATLRTVAYADLDTAWLLDGDPFEGGFAAQGPHITLPDCLGFGVIEKAST